MFSLTTTTHLHHTTPLPLHTSFQSTLRTLQNHDLLLRLDPELQSYTPLPDDPAQPGTKLYRVTDHMRALPKGLWDSTVTFEAGIRNVEDGVHWVIRAPLGLVQKTRWRVVRRSEVEGDGKEGEEEGELCLVEEVEIKASRLLVGTVKNKCEENWRGIHARFVAQLEGAGGTGTSEGTHAGAGATVGAGKGSDV